MDPPSTNTIPADGPPRIYFARAIDGENSTARYALASAVARELAVAGMLLVDPTADEPPEMLGLPLDDSARYRIIVEHDLSVLQSCDAMLMDISIPGRSYIGCICEMTYAYLWRIPCVAYIGTSDANRPWLHYHAAAVFQARSDAVMHLVQIFMKNGIISG